MCFLLCSHNFQLAIGLDQFQWTSYFRFVLDSIPMSMKTDESEFEWRHSLLYKYCSLFSVSAYRTIRQKEELIVYISPNKLQVIEN